CGLCSSPSLFSRFHGNVLKAHYSDSPLFRNCEHSNSNHYSHGRIKKPQAPGPGHVEGPPPPPTEKNVCARKTRTHAHAHTNTTNVLDFTVELRRYFGYCTVTGQSLLLNIHLR